MCPPTEFQPWGLSPSKKGGSQFLRTWFFKSLSVLLRKVLLFKLFSCVIWVHVINLLSRDDRVAGGANNKSCDVINFNNFSSYSKLLRIVCYIFRLLPKHANFRTPDKNVDPAELHRAEEGLIFLSQTESFAQKKKLLSLQKPVQSKSPILTYSPFIGPRGILRSTGRIRRFAEVDYDLKHSILLDGRHPFDNLYWGWLRP